MATIKTTVDILFGMGMFINALLFLPQAIKLYRYKSVSGLSIVVFLGFNFIQFFMMLHGIIRHDYILAGGMGLSLLTCGAVTIGIIIYRKSI